MKNKNKKNKYKKCFYRINIKTAVICAGVFLCFNLFFSNLAEAMPITTENLIELTNKERIKNNLPALSSHIILKKAANQKVSDLFAGGYFDHSSKDGRKFFEWIKDSGYYYLYAGENLAMDFITAEGVVSAWMKSPTHKANILSPYYEDIGIAAQFGNFSGRTTMIVVQMFGSPLFGENSLGFSDSNILSSEKGILILPSLKKINTFDVFNTTKDSLLAYGDKEEYKVVKNQHVVLTSSSTPYALKVRGQSVPIVAGENFIKENKFISQNKKKSYNFFLVFLGASGFMFLGIFISEAYHKANQITIKKTLSKTL